MRCLFRVDASAEIGTGHVVRCMTLAGVLRNHGVECHFACQDIPGHMIEAIRAKGYTVHVLSGEGGHGTSAYIEWLRRDQLQDAEQTSRIVADVGPDWIVVDSYALDATWHRVVRGSNNRLMVIDDLANRACQADMLLDQNLGHDQATYADLVPDDCHVLAGPEYALLRPEFAEARVDSLARRKAPRLEQVLISMGGADAVNATGEILAILKTSTASAMKRITVVMGAQAVWLDNVKALAASMPIETEVVIGVNNMAERMSCADLAIGAGGGTSWERCCLGLPSILVTVADNQREVAANLDKAGAAIHVGDVNGDQWKSSLVQAMNDLSKNPDNLKQMSANAAAVTDGMGAERVVCALLDTTVGSER